MYICLIFLVLPSLSLAQLAVQVGVATRAGDAAVRLLGEDEQVISDAEVAAFGLGDDQLKEACRRYHGARPTDAYLKSPTPWGDLFQRFGWTQVHRKLKPIKATVLGIHSEPTIIGTQKFHNNGSKPALYTADIKQEVSNTITHSWTSSDSISVKQEINYEFTIPVGKAGGKTTFSYSHSWGKGGSISQKVSVGVKSGVSVSVQPGATALATLTASRGAMEIEVVYEASLHGDVAANYEEGHNGHYFWRYDVGAVMGAGGVPHTRLVTDVIKIWFYADADIAVDDKYQGS